MSEQIQNLFNQVDEQVANGQPATVLVERTNGDITTAQTAGITQNETNVFFGDITEGPKQGMPYRTIGNEKLTDQYQEKLAEKLAGVALRESGIERNASAAPVQEAAGEGVGAKEVTSVAESPVDKYTEEFVKAHPYNHLLDPELTDDQRDAVLERVKGMDLRTDEQKRADAEQTARDAFGQQLIAADHKYNQARQAGASHEAADASARRANHKTYDELLADEFKNAGLQ